MGKICRHERRDAFMAISDLSIFQALKSKMHWHQSRQSLLAENVANTDTPGFRGRDLKPFDFKTHVAAVQVGLDTAVTRTGHLHGTMRRASLDGFAEKVGSFETTPDRNNVTLEEQMMKVTQNQMDFQAVSTLYSRGLGLIRSALSRNA